MIDQNLGETMYDVSEIKQMQQLYHLKINYLGSSQQNFRLIWELKGRWMSTTDKGGEACVRDKSLYDVTWRCVSNKKLVGDGYMNNLLLMSSSPCCVKH